jgi:allantoin racemase
MLEQRSEKWIECGVQPRIALINPNTNAATTTAMADIARTAAGDVVIDAITAPFGSPLITTPSELSQGAAAVEAVCAALPAGYDGVIVAAFGDPGLEAARARLGIPVTGLAEAGLLAAAAHGRFSVATTTPALVASIERLAERYGCAEALASVRLTPGDPTVTMGDPARLLAALEQACRTAIAEDGAQAIVIGGGPLAVAARGLRPRLPVPVIEPIPAAVARLLAAIAAARAAGANR